MTSRRAAVAVLVVAGVLALAGSSTAVERPPVNRWLPWHPAVVDARGELKPWTGYGRVLRLGWSFLEQMPRTYLTYPVFDPASGRGLSWQHNPASLYAGMVGSLVRWYPYSGDRRAVAVVRRMLDYELAHGTTPRGWSWGGVPLPTGCAGEPRYGGCLGGTRRSYHGGVEPDKVGLLGLGYLRFYELTGERRYLAAARAAATALAAHVRAGDDARTPWPFRVDARTGRTIEGAEYGGMLVAPIQLLDELGYRRARDVAWRWLLDHQLSPRSPDYHRFSGYYEDIAYRPDDLNAATASSLAGWLVTRRLDPQWAAHARSLLAWARSYLGRGPFHGAWGIDEQRTPGRRGCCSPAGLGSETGAWAAANALLSAATGDAAARRAAVRSLAYATYFADARGRVSCCGSGHPHGYWFSDGYGDYLGNLAAGIGALPQLAPRGESHLLASTSVVRDVVYSKRRVAYTTFAPSSETLRLAFRPVRIRAGRGATWTLERAGGDYVVRIRHAHARRVVVSGA